MPVKCCKGTSECSDFKFCLVFVTFGWQNLGIIQVLHTMNFTLLWSSHELNVQNTTKNAELKN